MINLKLATSTLERIRDWTIGWEAELKYYDHTGGGILHIPPSLFTDGQFPFPFTKGNRCRQVKVIAEDDKLIITKARAKSPRADIFQRTTIDPPRMDNLTSHDAEVYLNSDFVSCNQFPLLVPSKVRLQVDPKAKTLIVVKADRKN